MKNFTTTKLFFLAVLLSSVACSGSKDAQPVSDAGTLADIGQTLDAQVLPDTGPSADADTEIDAGTSEDTGALVYEYRVPDSSICDDTLTTTTGYLCAIRPSRLDSSARDTFSNRGIAYIGEMTYF